MEEISETISTIRRTDKEFQREREREENIFIRDLICLPRGIGQRRRRRKTGFKMTIKITFLKVFISVGNYSHKDNQLGRPTGMRFFGLITTPPPQIPCSSSYRRLLLLFGRQSDDEGNKE